VSQKYGIFEILEYKSTTSIGQHVSLWNFEHFLNINYGLFKLWAVKNSKKIKKVLPKDGVFQISEHKFSLTIGQCVSFSNFKQFLYIKRGLFKLGILRKSK